MTEKLLVASTYLPPFSGGAERVALEVARRLTRKFEVHVITTSKAGVPAQEDVTIHRVPPFPLLTVAYSTVLKNMINKVLKEVRPDIVHSHMALPWGYVLRTTGSSRVITCHGSDVFPYKHFPERYFLISALGSACVTAPSKWLTDSICEGYKVRCVTIPNGVDTASFRPLQEAKRKDVVLFVGRFIERKGAFELIQLAKALPEYDFWVVGDPEKERDAVKVPHLSNLKEIGFVRDLTECYNEATVCVFPSHWENFPLVGLEAMACGKAVVATRIGFSEYIENGQDGILVESQDVAAMIDCIKYLMTHGDARHELEKNAREKAILYSWDRVADGYADLYKRLRG